MMISSLPKTLADYFSLGSANNSHYTRAFSNYRTILAHTNAFAHSFRLFLSRFSSTLQSLLPRDVTDTARILFQSFTPKGYRQLQVNDLPKIPTWQLERD